MKNLYLKKGSNKTVIGAFETVKQLAELLNTYANKTGIKELLSKKVFYPQNKNGCYLID